MRRHIDKLTMVGWGMLLMPLLTMWHEIGGHAAFCAAQGGHVTTIGAFYVECDVSGESAQLARRLCRRPCEHPALARRMAILAGFAKRPGSTSIMADLGQRRLCRSGLLPLFRVKRLRRSRRRQGRWVRTFARSARHPDRRGHYWRSGLFRAGQSCHPFTRLDDRQRAPEPRLRAARSATSIMRRRASRR